MSLQDIRNRLAQNAKTRRGLVTVNIGDGPITFAVRGITVGARKRCMDNSRVVTEDADGKPLVSQDDTKLAMLMVMECTRDPESDARVWEDKDEALVMELPAELLDELAIKAGELSASSAKAKEEKLGNSDATPPATSSSN